MKNSIKVLGSGTSTGVPILGCSCKICQSTSVKNKRMRTSILITNESNNKNILIDTTPDMRTQLLQNDVNQLDCAIITHEHADHTHGVDDLRAFCFWRDDDFPVYTSQNCFNDLVRKFPYIFNRESYFKNKKVLGGGIPLIKTHVLEMTTPIEIMGLNFEFFQLPHGHIPSMGFICEKMAYIIDCNNIPKPILEKLKLAKLDLLILDLNSIKPHQTHLHLEKSVEYAKAIGAKCTRFIHLNHDHDHANLSNHLISLGLIDTLPTYDGEVLQF